MAQQMSWSDVHKGHDVCDRSGSKIGTVRNVRQIGRAMGGQPAPTEGYVECDCTLPDVGKELYIPFNAFQRCDGTCCYLNLNKDDIANKGWQRKPANL